MKKCARVFGSAYGPALYRRLERMSIELLLLLTAKQPVPGLVLPVQG